MTYLSSRFCFSSFWAIFAARKTDPSSKVNFTEQLARGLCRGLPLAKFSFSTTCLWTNITNPLHNFQHHQGSFSFYFLLNLDSGRQLVWQRVAILWVLEMKFTWIWNSLATQCDSKNTLKEVGGHLTVPLQEGHIFRKCFRFKVCSN